MKSKVLALAVVFGLGGCVDGSPGSAEVSAEVFAATVIGDGTEVEFGVDICERPLLDFVVTETPEEVRVRAVTTDEKDMADCALIEQVTLQEPLGERILVDAGSGERITQVYHSNRVGES